MGRGGSGIRLAPTKLWPRWRSSESESLGWAPREARGRRGRNGRHGGSRSRRWTIGLSYRRIPHRNDGVLTGLSSGLRVGRVHGPGGMKICERLLHAARRLHLEVEEVSSLQLFFGILDEGAGGQSLWGWLMEQRDLGDGRFRFA